MQAKMRSSDIRHLFEETGKPVGLGGGIGPSQFPPSRATLRTIVIQIEVRLLSIEVSSLYSTSAILIGVLELMRRDKVSGIVDDYFGCLFLQLDKRIFLSWGLRPYRTFESERIGCVGQFSQVHNTYSSRQQQRNSMGAASSSDKKASPTLMLVDSVNTKSKGKKKANMSLKDRSKSAESQTLPHVKTLQTTVETSKTRSISAGGKGLASWSDDSVRMKKSPSTQKSGVTGLNRVASTSNHAYQKPDMIGVNPYASTDIVMKKTADPNVIESEILTISPSDESKPTSQRGQYSEVLPQLNS
ncbi:hypothetical protein PROFUN_02569 [Planoprotostelium fungivorum]|uniref:Uncharacterized protein n=1 Tax=Planoprotostelium fungivorum TaxID=1890364 RepID=A0A2P6MPC5_9EUKA|nr:hypothetical protein PROFUN_02569 [Planoprotostelium fungivorum]